MKRRPTLGDLIRGATLSSMVRYGVGVATVFPTGGGHIALESTEKNPGC